MKPKLSAKHTCKVLFWFYVVIDIVSVLYLCNNPKFTLSEYYLASTSNKILALNIMLSIFIIPILMMLSPSAERKGND